MPPKGKGPGGKEISRPPDNDGGEKDLSYFQGVFANVKDCPPATIKRTLKELECILDDGITKGNKTVERLARLCRARLQYELFCRDPNAHKSERDDAGSRLKPLYEAVPFSMTAVCLETAFASRGATTSVDKWSVASEAIEKCVKLADAFAESDWADPAEEAINNTIPKESFEDFKDAKTKGDRLKELSKYRRSSEKRARKNAELQRKQQVPGTSSNAGYGPVNNQQPTEDRAQEGKHSEEQENALKEMGKFLNDKEKVERDLALVMEVIEAKLKQHGPAGSKERAREMCKLFLEDLPTFESELDAKVEDWLKECGMLPQPSGFRALYTQQLAAQLARFRASGNLLQLNRPDLKELMEKTYNLHLQDTAAGGSAATTGKDDKGDVPSGSSKGGGKRGANKASARDQDKRSSAPPATTSGTVSLPEFMDWFVKSLKERGVEIRNKLVEVALPEVVGGQMQGGQVQEEEAIALRRYNEKAPSLADMLLLRNEAPTSTAGAPKSLHEELVKRARLGDLLLTTPLEGDESAPAVPSFGLNQKMESATQDRIRFATDLSKLNIFQRYDVFSTIAEAFAIMSTLVEDTSQTKVQPSKSMFPRSPLEAADSLGDPVAMLEGYMHLLRHRGVLPLKGPVRPADGVDEAEARLLRLCDWMLCRERHDNDRIIIGSALHESTKQEHGEVLRRLYGELPLVLSKRLQAAAAKASEGLPNGSAAVDANVESPADVETGDGKQERNETNGNGASDESFLGPFLEFDIRTELPASERAVLDERWRADVLDAVAAMQDGCRLGRCMSMTISKYLTEAVGEEYTDVPMEREALRAWVSRLTTEQLLHLRFFLLSQLGMRAEATLTSMNDRIEKWQRISREELWGVAIVKGNGKQADKVQLSEAAYWNFYRKARAARRKYLLRLQIIHAWKRHIAKKSPAGTAGAPGSAAAPPAALLPSTSGTTPAGGGKKKGKGGGGAGNAGSGAAAVASGTTVAVPPLPPGVPQLEDIDESDLLDMVSLHENTDEVTLVGWLHQDEVLCTYEIKEQLREALDPVDDAAQPGEDADAIVAEGLLSTYLPSPSNQFEAAPAYTITEVLEDLSRASLLEALRGGALDTMSAQLQKLLQCCAGLLQDFTEKGTKEQFVDALKPFVSGWMLDALEKAEPSGDRGKTTALLADLESVKRTLNSEAFELHSRAIRFSVLNHAARSKVTNVIVDKLEQLLPQQQTQQQTLQQTLQQTAKGANKQNKTRPTDESQRDKDVGYELKMAKAERDFVMQMKNSAVKLSDEILGLAREAKAPVSIFQGSLKNPGPKYEDTPQAAAGATLLALQAAQHLALTIMVMEMLVEVVQVQARVALASSLLNDPVMDVGLVGAPLAIRWLQDKLRGMPMKHLLEEEEEKKSKEIKERDRKQEEKKKKKEEERRREEEEARKREEEEARQRQEREEQEAREREEQEAREREEARVRKEQEEQEAAAARKAEEAKRSQSKMRSVMESYSLYLSTDEMNAAFADGAAEDKTKAQQQGGKGGADAAASGKKDNPPVRMNARDKEKEQQRHQQSPPHQQPQGVSDAKGRRDGPAGPSGGAGGAKGDTAHRRGGPGHQQQQGQLQQGPSQGKPGAVPGGTAGAGAVASGTGPGKDAGGKPGYGHQQAPSGGSGKGDRPGQLAGAGPQQQQQSQGGRGGHSGKGAGGGVGAAGKAGSAAPATTQQAHPRSVPGFHPSEDDPLPAPDGKQSKSRRNRRGGGGGVGGELASSAAAAAAAASGRAAADRRPAGAGSFGVAGDDEHPHPPAAGVDGEGVPMVDLTESAAPAVDVQPVQEPKYPLVHPYPFEPPEGWKLYQGYLIPDDQDVDALMEQGLPDHRQCLTDPQVLEEVRRTYLDVLAATNLAEREPVLPPGAYKDYSPQGQEPQHPRQLPYAVPASIPADYNQQNGGVPAVQGLGTEAAGPPVGSSPPSAYAGAEAPAYGTGAPPGNWGGYPGVPPFAPPFLRPQAIPPGLVAAPAPFPGGPMVYPYGMPPMMRPPLAPMAGPSEPQAELDTEEQEDTDDLLGLLGVQSQSQAPRPAAPVLVATPTAPMYPPFAGFPGHVQAPYGAQPPEPLEPTPGLRHQPADLQLQSGLDLPPPPAAAPYTPQVQPAPPQGRAPEPAAAPAGPPAMSWAQRAAPKSAAPVGRPAAERPQDTDDVDMDSEEQQLKAAVHQSMRDNMNVAFPPLAAGASGRAGLPPPAAAGTSQELALVAGGAVGTGLVNRVGEYNCFLNVIIQCLWHCAAFRQQLHSYNPVDFDSEHPVVAALLRLFHALDVADAAREQQRQQLANSEVAAERHVVDPSELREALDALGVRAGEMNDASEVLGALFDQLNRAPGLSGAGTMSVVDRTFGLLLSEEVRCTVHNCGRITHIVPQHVEYFMIITATGLRDMHAVIEGGSVSMGRIIREIEAQNIKRCDNDPPHHGCNTPTRVTRTLHNVPAVFTVQLAWEPDVPADAIAGTLKLVDTVLDPKEIFAGGNCPGGTPSYALHGMFCYYGQHYFAFINRGPVEPESAQEWVMFDDATVAAVGNWAAVINKCRAGRIQPSVLFYQQYP